jgi:uncharacterized protein with HEPN domain
MNKALRLPDYLGHILKAIERIEEYVGDMDEMAFLDSKLVQDAVCRNIEIIGEASNNILRVQPSFAAQHAHIPWQVMYAMRNRVSHGYDKWTLKWSGRPFTANCPACMRRSRYLFCDGKTCWPCPPKPYLTPPTSNC